MQALIFCGGFGTRINKGSKVKKLKPLIKINKKEILLRIIEIYKKNGIKDFILLGGYKIKELKKFSKKVKDVNIQVLDTGLKTETGGRLLRAKKLIKNNNFLLTYGDSLASFSLKKNF
jgi:glucose-1-phosphate cytidylyltransferase